MSLIMTGSFGMSVNLAEIIQISTQYIDLRAEFLNYLTMERASIVNWSFSKKLGKAAWCLLMPYKNP